MNASDHAHTHAAHAHAAHGGPPHASRKDYVVGFVLAAVLTAIPFWLVMAHPLGSAALTALAVVALAGVQVVVHMIYFLHMNSRSEGGWNMLALMFTLLLVGIVFVGSIWVMHHLDTNMMPMTAQAARQMP